MKLNKQTVGVFLAAIGTMVLGGVCSKYLSVEAGTAVTGAGGMLMGLLMRQPAFAAGERKPE